MNPIRNLSIRGYKSIRELDSLDLGNLNVLIGANGAGKSNFITCRTVACVSSAWPPYSCNRMN